MRQICLALIVLVIIGLMLYPMAQAAAQTETPTPVPSYSSTADLSGGTLLIERRVTFGDLFVGFAALLVAVVIGASTLPDLGERLFKR